MRHALLFLLLATTAWAKPMMPATMEEAAKVPLIVVARYEGYSTPHPVTYFDGPQASYKIVKVLKTNGCVTPQMLRVRYDFHDLTPCLPDQSFKWDPNVMPAQSSQWILFLNPVKEDLFTTYRGEWGRKPATEENLCTVNQELSKKN